MPASRQISRSLRRDAGGFARGAGAALGELPPAGRSRASTATPSTRGPRTCWSRTPAPAGSPAATGCCRSPTARGSRASYSAQFYELSRLARLPWAECSRSAGSASRPAARRRRLRVAWAALAGYVERNGIELLFGCSSFSGTETARLRRRLCPAPRPPPRTAALAAAGQGAGGLPLRPALRFRRPDPAAAMRAMPPLLRTYLAMGGWVSDHAVVDRDLGTLHVFTGLEVRAVPPPRPAAARRRATPAEPPVPGAGRPDPEPLEGARQEMAYPSISH